MEYRKLKGRIVEICGSQAEFSKKANLSENIISKKLNGQCGISQDDVYNWCNILEIDQHDIGTYFFPQKLQGR